MIKIKSVQNNLRNQSFCDEYIKSHKLGSVFHLTSWKKVVEKTFKHKSHYFYAEKGNKICGIFPVFEIKSLLFGHFFVSIPFAEIGGIIADNELIERKLFNSALEICKTKGGSYLELRNRAEKKGLLTKSLYYTFKKEISFDHDKNLKEIPRKSRAMVRKALKSGLKSENGHHLIDDFYKILSLNYHRLGTPVFPKRFFKNFLEEFKENSGILTVKTEKNELAAAVLYFTYNNQMIPYYAGSDFTYRSYGPNDFMYWELMKLGAEKKCNIFDFGRSKVNTGSFSFKKHWGFKPEPLAYQYELINTESLPNLSPANPKYQKKIELWKKMPLEVSKIIGPFISKDLV
ncbi:MAG: FemAB family PEP-CTERM system-associated protein [Desulforegulaceae bacterium]|nr:FemAB family PEP-CTERM system-associated protein [Desulforegulaceae bacterium]